MVSFDRQTTRTNWLPALPGELSPATGRGHVHKHIRNCMVEKDTSIENVKSNPKKPCKLPMNSKPKIGFGHKHHKNEEEFIYFNTFAKAKNMVCYAWSLMGVLRPWRTWVFPPLRRRKRLCFLVPSATSAGLTGETRRFTGISPPFENE